MDSNEDPPVLIDRHHVARATPDMVFVTQHIGVSTVDVCILTAREEAPAILCLYLETLVSCNGRPLLGNL